ncbi:S-layer homology domain-containing protein, partial [Microbacterium sp. HD4P20]|uniref:S-layer homology domain-containing protein n=1 Tax=Microbacterium sp. HD4P20 TaxID=2864874 RepID=UPI001C63F534
FVDVSSVSSSPVFNVFARDIVWLSSSGISTGWALPDGAKEFRPGAAVTRDVMAAFLYRLAGQPQYTPPAVSPFADVPATYTFYKEIAWLASTGISGGWEVGDSLEYRPGASVTRDVMAAFLYRMAGEPSFVAPTVSPFTDVAVDNVFYEEIAWMASTGISAGWTVDGVVEYRPGGVVTRDVMSAFLHRLHAYLNA